MTVEKSSSISCALPECDDERRARALCNRHYQRSKRRFDGAGKPDGWDWAAGASARGASRSSRGTRGRQPAGAAQNFTGGARKVAGGVRGSPPPTEDPGETETETRRTISLEIAVEAALDQLPEPVRCGWQAAAIRVLAETLEWARWAENVQPSAAGVSQLWVRLSALEEEYTTAEESDAIDELGALLLAELAGAEGP